MMNHSKQTQNQLFATFMKQNQNSDIYKSLIGNVAKGIQQRTFWYFTSDDAEFLGNVYNKQINRQILKTRIQQITQEKMNQVLGEIVDNKLSKKRIQDQDGLQVQLDFQDLQDRITGNYKPDRGKQKLREINEDFKRFKDKMDEIKRYQEMKKQQKTALEQQFKKSLQKQKREEQRQQIRKNLQLLRQSGDERKESNEKFKAFFKEFKRTKPMHVLMQQEYKQKIELPTIQENRKKLQMLAHKKKPTLEEINNHDRYYIESKSSRPEKIIQNQTVDVSFKSQFYQQQQEKLREFKDLEENGYQWDYLQKQKRYSQFVKDKVKPKVSPKLKEALQQSLVKGYVHFQVPDRSKVIQVGKNYLEFMRSLQKNRRSSTPNKSESIKQSRYINYLQELKARSEHSHTTLDWERDLKDRGTSKLQKRQRILMKSKQLEQKAMRDEKFVSNNNFGRAEQIINKKKQIDQTLLSSIRAKVAVLKDAREP